VEFQAHEVELHGHRCVYRLAGEGPAVVLIHGMVNTSHHWRRVALGLADDHTVVAPDLIGHGESSAMRGDYSIGAHAARIRDVLTAIGIERSTIVGHSLGGGVAMQFFYQFPQRVERLALISSGGLGPDVSPLLRAAALPGASALLAALADRRVVAGLDRSGAALRTRGIGLGAQLRSIARALAPLGRPGAREAFLQTLRAVIDTHGQRVSATDRLHLLEHMPTLFVWGERDHTIPPAHGAAAHAAIPGSRFESVPGAAHFPHLENSEAVTAILARWLAEMPAAHIEDGDWGAIAAGRQSVRAP
jgi:pimeloyl-ACP methyl ester carboxylesterase